MDRIHGIYQWILWKLLLHNDTEPYISGLHVPRHVQKCRGFIFLFFETLPARSRQSCKKYTIFSDNVPQCTSVKLSYELGKITFSTGEPKLTPGEVSTFQGF